MRRVPLTALAALLLAPVVPATAATTLTIRGAGFGHGIGMSQYGALGYAQHGWTHEQILGHYYTGTQLGQAPDGEVVRVLLQSPPVATFSGATAAGSRTLQAASTYRVARSALGLTLQSATGRSLGRFAAPLRVTGPGPLRLGGTAGNGVRDGLYRGWLEFRPGTLGGVNAINAIGLEQYVAGVISRESPASWPLEALEAQAVAARTYAVTTSAGGSQGFDQYPDTRSQVYGGVAAETPATNAATNGSRGQVVTYGGRPVVTFFFSTSGGRTENVEDSFIGSPPRPWLKSVDDPYDSVSPVHRWGPIRLTGAAAGARLKGLVKGSFRSIRVLERGGSPRIVRALVVGSGGTVPVTGPTLRARLGVRDTWMTFNAVSTDVGPAPAPAAPAGGAQAARARGRRVTGTVEPGRRGQLVVLQRRVGDEWHRAGHTYLGRTHRYKVALPAGGTYRVVVGRTVGPTVRTPRR